MWKVLLTFVFQRTLLVFVVFFTLNQKLTPPQAKGILSPAQPVHVLWQQLLIKMKELKIIDSARLSSAHPVNMLHKYLNLLFGEPLLTELLLANLLLILFLFELHTVLSRMVMSDAATTTTLLVLLLPSSYELSLVSSFTLVCFFIPFVIHHAFSNQWILVGLGLSTLAFCEPRFILLLPLLLFIFIYFQRHIFLGQLLKRALYFVAPLILFFVFRLNELKTLSVLFETSTLNEVYTLIKNGKGFGGLLENAMLGQTITLILLLFGTLMAFFCSVTLIYRIIPVYLLLFLLSTSPYSELSSQAPLAALCFVGIATVCVKPLARLLLMIMFSVGFYEVLKLFS